MSTKTRDDFRYQVVYGVVQTRRRGIRNGQQRREELRDVRPVVVHPAEQLCDHDGLCISENGVAPTETCSSHPSSMVIRPQMLVDVFCIEMDRIRDWRTIVCGVDRFICIRGQSPFRYCVFCE